MAVSEPILGVVLAGGLSRRMGGGDKGLLDLGGRPMLGRIVERLQPQVTSVILNANGDPGRFAPFGLPVIRDSVEDYAGPLAGVLAGLEWARAETPEARFIATAAADTPFFPGDLVARLLGGLGSRYPAIALARTAEGMHPTFGLWPTALAQDLRQALAGGTRKVLAWTDRHETVAVDFPPQSVGKRVIDPFFNVNRPDELADAEALLREHAT
jgi:molybdenum cofactor guanylyltransferase